MAFPDRGKLLAQHKPFEGAESRRIQDIAAELRRAQQALTERARSIKHIEDMATRDAEFIAEANALAAREQTLQAELAAVKKQRAHLKRAKTERAAERRDLQQDAMVSVLCPGCLSLHVLTRARI